MAARKGCSPPAHNNNTPLPRGRREILEERYGEALENVAFLTDAPYEMITLVLERAREVLCPEGFYVYHR